MLKYKYLIKSCVCFVFLLFSTLEEYQIKDNLAVLRFPKKATKITFISLQSLPNFAWA